MNRKWIELKCKIGWRVGAALSAALFFSGIVPTYSCLRARARKFTVTVLMYHRVDELDCSKDMTVAPDNFRRQMDYLRRSYDIVSMDELTSRFISGNEVPARNTVAITFDDGFKDNYANAFPVLKKDRIPATIFVEMNFVNQEHGLTEAEIAEMGRNGVTFGAHTISHPVLSTLDRDRATKEIADSIEALEKVVGTRVKYFAYPYGKKDRDFTDESMDIVRAAGIKAAFATDNGFVDCESNPFSLNRIGVRNFPLFVFKCRISGIYENRFVHLIRRMFRV